MIESFVGASRPGGRSPGVLFTGEPLVPAEPWMARGLCTQTDPEMFFPEKGGSTRDAKRVCASCDVRAQCLAYALEHDERFGIWGGLSNRERIALRKRSRRVA